MEAAKTKYQKQMQSLRASHASQSEIKAAEQAQQLEAVKEELKLTQEKLMVSQKTAKRSMAEVTQCKNDAAASETQVAQFKNDAATSKAKAAEYQRQIKKLEEEKAAECKPNPEKGESFLHLMIARCVVACN